jgi:hypothetical protein
MPLINIRVTEAERTALKKKAALQSLTLSDFIRRAVHMDQLTGEPYKAPRRVSSKPKERQDGIASTEAVQNSKTRRVASGRGTSARKPEGGPSTGPGDWSANGPQKAESQEGPRPEVTPLQVANRIHVPVKTAERMTKGKQVEIIDGKVHVNGVPL